MSKVELTEEEYDSLIYKVATLESELKRARNLLEAPPKISLWWRLWGGGGKALMAGILLVVVMVRGGGADTNFFTGNDWLKLGKSIKQIYVEGFSDGTIVAKTQMDRDQRQFNAVWECTRNWTGDQHLAVIEKYLKDNPHERHNPMFVLVWLAKIDACAKR